MKKRVIDAMKQAGNFGKGVLRANIQPYADAARALQRQAQHIADAASKKLNRKVTKDQLRAASGKGHPEIIKALLAGSLIDANTLLSWAAREGLHDVVQELLNLPNIYVKQEDKNGYTALENAVIKGHLEIVDTLLNDKRVELTYAKRRESLIFLAARYGHTAVLKSLLAAIPRDTGYEYINYQGTSKTPSGTALSIAVYYNHPETVMALLEDPRVNPDYFDIQSGISSPSNSGATGLCAWAIKGNHFDIAKKIFSLRKSLVIHLNLLHREISKNHPNPEMVRILQNHMSNVNEEFVPTSPLGAHAGYTALMFAALYGKTEAVNVLLENPKLHLANNFFETALSLAARHGHTEIVKALLRDRRIQPYYINSPNQQGNTAIHEAAINGHPETVAALLEDPRVDITIINKNGDTAQTAAHRERSKTFSRKLIPSQMNIGIMGLKRATESAEYKYRLRYEKIATLFQKPRVFPGATSAARIPADRDRSNSSNIVSTASAAEEAKVKREGGLYPSLDEPLGESLSDIVTEVPSSDTSDSAGVTAAELHDNDESAETSIIKPGPSAYPNLDDYPIADIVPHEVVAQPAESISAEEWADRNGMALIEAVRDNQPKKVKKFLQNNNINVAWKNEDGDTAFTLAVKLSHTKVLKALLADERIIKANQSVLHDQTALKRFVLGERQTKTTVDFLNALSGHGDRQTSTYLKDLKAIIEAEERLKAKSNKPRKP